MASSSPTHATPTKESKNRIKALATTVYGDQPFGEGYHIDLWRNEMSGYWVCTLLRGSDVFREQKFVVNGGPRSSAPAAVEALLKGLEDLARENIVDGGEEGEEESRKDGKNGEDGNAGNYVENGDEKIEGYRAKRSWFCF